jgi:hypothetical protein
MVILGRIPEKMVPTSILKSCAAKVTITPKVMTLADMKTANDQYIGCLIKVQNAEFDAKVLCSILLQMVTLLIGKLMTLQHQLLPVL